MFAVVLYVNQPTDARPATSAMAQLTAPPHRPDRRRSAGASSCRTSCTTRRRSCGASYPEIDAFFAAKRRYDPDELLTSTFYERFGRK